MASRGGGLELSTTKHTQWLAISRTCLQDLEYTFRPRALLQACDVTKLALHSAFDYAGVVVGLSPPVPGRCLALALGGI